MTDRQCLHQRRYYDPDIGRWRCANCKFWAALGEDDFWSGWDACLETIKAMGQPVHHAYDSWWELDRSESVWDKEHYVVALPADDDAVSTSEGASNATE